MKRVAFLLLIFAGIFLLEDCASPVAAKGTFPVFYSNDRSAPLLPVSAGGSAIEERQRLEGTYGDRKFSAESWMLLNDSTITLLLLSPMGTSIGELVYTKDSIFYKSAWIDAKKVKPEYILADIQFCYYPSETLAKNFKKYGFDFVENVSDSATVRILSEDGNEIAEMRKSGAEIRFENRLRKYGYRIVGGVVQ